MRRDDGSENGALDLRSRDCWLSRRTVLKASAAAAGVGLIGSKAFSVEAGPAHDFVDTLVFLEEFPFRHVTDGNTNELAVRLRRAGVSQAWAGTFDGLLHKDLAGANERLANACRSDGDGLFLPFGAINIALPDWEEDVRRCHEVHGMRGVRLHPSYHGYSLNDPRFVRLLEACSRRRLIVQIVPWIEDERHVYLQLPQSPLDLKLLTRVAPQYPNLPIVVYGNGHVAEAAIAAELLQSPNVSFGLALPDKEESAATIRQFADRLVVASWAPLHDLTPVENLLQGAGLGASQLNDVRAGRARRLLP
jgi:predicted TIM-barrel fold metal-dependent hydrolase